MLFDKIRDSPDLSTKDGRILTREDVRNETYKLSTYQSGMRSVICPGISLRAEFAGLSGAGYLA